MNTTALGPFATAFNLTACDDVEGTELNLDARKRSECAAYKSNKTIALPDKKESSAINKNETVNRNDSVGVGLTGVKNNSSEALTPVSNERRAENSSVDSSPNQPINNRTKSEGVNNQTKSEGVNNLAKVESVRLQGGKYLDNDIAPELTKSIMEAEKTLREKSSPSLDESKFNKVNILEAEKTLREKSSPSLDESKFNKVNVNESFDLSSVNESEGFDLRKQLNETESSDSVFPNSTAVRSGTVANVATAEDVPGVEEKKSETKETGSNMKETGSPNVDAGGSESVDASGGGLMVKEEGPLGFIRNTSSDDVTESVDGGSVDKNPMVSKNTTLDPMNMSLTNSSHDNTTMSKKEDGEGKDGIVTLMQAVEGEAGPDTQPHSKSSKSSTSPSSSSSISPTSSLSPLLSNETTTNTDLFAQYFTASRNKAVENIKSEISSTLINLSHTSPQLAQFSSKLDSTFKKVFAVSEESELLSPNFASILSKLKNISSLLQQEAPAKRSRQHENNVRLLQDIMKELKSFVVA